MKLKLLSAGATNAKLAKDSARGVLNYILYLAPFTQNSKGINLCPKASTACAAACLFTAGRGAFNSVKAARVRKTEFLLSNRVDFLLQLWDELEAVNRDAGKRFKVAAVRLNGTSAEPDKPPIRGLTNHPY